VVWGELAEGQLNRERRNVMFLRSASIRGYLAVARLRDEEKGQALVEYALILLLVSVVSISILTALGGHVSSMFERVSNGL
jgi:pilus assembly protein Flp/PilA